MDRNDLCKQIDILQLWLYDTLNHKKWEFLPQPTQLFKHTVMVVDMKVDKVAEDMADMVANMEAQITTTNHAICIDAIVLGRLAPFLKSESLSFYFWCK